MTVSFSSPERFGSGLAMRLDRHMAPAVSIEQDLKGLCDAHPRPSTKEVIDAIAARGHDIGDANVQKTMARVEGRHTNEAEIARWIAQCRAKGWVPDAPASSMTKAAASNGNGGASPVSPEPRSLAVNGGDTVVNARTETKTKTNGAAQQQHEVSAQFDDTVVKHSPPPANDDATRMAALFAGSERAHVTHGEPYQEPGSLKWEIKNTARTVRSPATANLWRRHLAGEYPLVAIPIRGDNKCLWGSIDVDEYGGNVLRLVERIERTGLPLVPCRSKSGGLHLFMFLEEWSPARDVQDVLKVFRQQLGLKEETEIFPKQTENKDVGNGIAMPYGTDFGGKIRQQVGLKKTGAEMELSEFLQRADNSKVSPEQLAELRDTPRCGRNGAAHSDSDAAGVAHAVQRLARYAKEVAAAPEGERNNLLNKAAHEMGRMVGAGWIDQEKVEADLRTAAAACGLPHDEISSIIPRVIEEGKLKSPPDLPGAKHEKQKNQTEILLEIAEDAELFHTPDGTGYADLIIKGHRETRAIGSRDFRRWLVQRYFEITRGAPSSEARQNALHIIDARASFGTGERKVSVRIGGHAGKIYLDLADEEWRAVEIGADGWRVVNSPPVRFRRPNGMLSLPQPSSGGSVSDLRRVLNLDAEADFTLLVAWLLAALRDCGPYPALVVAGEQGSAKSFLAAILRALFDPNTAPLRSLPREDRDLFITARNGHVLAFDNVSGLPHWISDTLCRLATGGGFATRELHTDQEEVLFDAVRPIILNGIEDVVNRPDLADRAVMLNLSPITDDKRRTEKEIWSEFRAMHAAVLGALLDAVAHGLRELPNTKLKTRPRMADFALWATACEGALDLPCTFESAYSNNRAQAAATVIEANPVADAVRNFIADKTQWAGTATELLGILSERTSDAVRRDRNWPGAPHVLTGRLKRAATFLRQVGIEINFGAREGITRRVIRITNVGAQGELDLTKGCEEDAP